MFFKNGKIEPQNCSLLEISKHFLSIWAPSCHHGDGDAIDPLTFIPDQTEAVWQNQNQTQFKFQLCCLMSNNQAIMT